MGSRKNFLFPGKKFHEWEHFGKSHIVLLCKNSVAIVCKSMDGAWCRASPGRAFTTTFIHNTGPGRRRLLIDLTLLTSDVWGSLDTATTWHSLTQLLTHYHLLCSAHSLWIEHQTLSTAGVVTIHSVMTVDCMNYITASSTWDPRCCQAICQWPVLHASVVVKSDRWYPCVPMHATASRGMGHPRAQLFQAKHVGGPLPWVIERRNGRQEGRGEVIKHAAGIRHRWCWRHDIVQRNRVWQRATGVHCVNTMQHFVGQMVRVYLVQLGNEYRRVEIRIRTYNSNFV